jgi:hypothetical protein
VEVLQAAELYTGPGQTHLNLKTGKDTRTDGGGGRQDGNKGGKKRGRDDSDSKNQHDRKRTNNQPQGSGSKCKGCGRGYHVAKDCRFKNHPDFNKSIQDWNESTSGKAWADRD